MYLVLIPCRTQTATLNQAWYILLMHSGLYSALLTGLSEILTSIQSPNDLNSEQSPIKMFLWKIYFSLNKKLRRFSSFFLLKAHNLHSGIVVCQTWTVVYSWCLRSCTNVATKYNKRSHRTSQTPYSYKVSFLFIKTVLCKFTDAMFFKRPFFL